MAYGTWMLNASFTKGSQIIPILRKNKLPKGFFPVNILKAPLPSSILAT